MRHIRRLIMTCIAVFLTWASIALVYLPWIFGGEKSVITRPTAIKTALNRWVFKNKFYDTAFIRDRFLIVNTTHDQELTREKDPLDGAGPGIPIVDRRKLTRLLQICYENTDLFNFIICDVSFDLPSMNQKVDDSLSYFVGLLQSKRKIIFGMSYDKSGNSWEGSVIPVETKYMGATNRDAVSGYYFRHTLSYSRGEVKSLPFLLYSLHHDTEIKPDWLPEVVRYDGNNGQQSFYNSFIPEIFFDKAAFDTYSYDPARPEALFYDSRMAICDLGKIVGDQDGTLMKSLLKTHGGKKDIFIGAIKGEHADRYNTLYGLLDGTIILLNTYFCLEMNYNRMYLLHLLISFIFFLYIAYRIVYEKEVKIRRKTLAQYIWQGIKKRLYYLLLLLLTLISYFWFKHATNLIVLLIIIESFHWVAGEIRKFRIEKLKDDQLEGE